MRTFRSVVATLVVGSMAFGSAVQPARADTTSTLLITAAAAIALMTGINVAEKNAKAHQVVGYLPNGSVVYADGHVVAPNGQSWYPGNYGENISCNMQRCYITGGNVGYGSPYPPGYGGYQSGYGSGYPSNGGYYGGYPSNGGYYGGYPSNGGYYGGYPSGGGYTGGTYYPLPPAPRTHPRTPADPVSGPIRAPGQGTGHMHPDPGTPGMHSGPIRAHKQPPNALR